MENVNRIFSSLVLIRPENIKLRVPLILACNWPYEIPFNEFPSFCGAGDGFGDVIVPESYWGLPVSHVCFIHDVTHTIFPPTNDMWHLSNELMLLNSIRTIRAKTRNPVLLFFRELRATSYFSGVETETGWNCFAQRDGGNQGQDVYDPAQDQTFIAKLNKVGITDILNTNGRNEDALTSSNHSTV